MHANTHTLKHARLTYELISLSSSSELLVKPALWVAESFLTWKCVTWRDLNWGHTCHILVMVLPPWQPQYSEPQCEACAEGMVAFLYWLHEWKDEVTNKVQMWQSSFLVNTSHKHLRERSVGLNALGQFHWGLTIKPATNHICHLVARGNTHLFHINLSVQCSHCVRFCVTTALKKQPLWCRVFQRITLVDLRVSWPFHTGFCLKARGGCYTAALS